MKKKYIVTLSKVEGAKVFETVDAQDTPKTIRKRCNILLLADTAVGKPATQEEIAARCGVSGRDPTTGKAKAIRKSVYGWSEKEVSDGLCNDLGQRTIRVTFLGLAQKKALKSSSFHSLL